LDGGYIIRDAGAYAIASRDLDLLIGLENPDCARVYLFLLKNGATSEGNIAETLGLSAGRVNAALKALCNAGLAGAGSAPARSSPTPNYELPAEYTSAEISGALERDQGFKWLIDEAQRRLGKVFTAADIGAMLRIYQWLGLPVEVIGLLITYCVEDVKRKNGEGRMPTVRQIEKEALIWDEEGIHTAEKADEYIRRKFKAREKQGEILSRLGVSDLTPSVEKYISQWIDWGFEPDVIYHAYDITVLKTGSLKWAYLNTILKNWRENNFMTIDQIEKKDYKPQGGYPKGDRTLPGQREKEIVKRNQSYGKTGKE
jgi:DnaD/phage-associated family protein